MTAISEQRLDAFWVAREERVRGLANLARDVLDDIVPQYRNLVRRLLNGKSPYVQADRAPDDLAVFHQACLALGLPLTRACRMLAAAGTTLAGPEPDDDPRVLLALFSALGESYLSLATIAAVSDAAIAFPALPEEITRLVCDPALGRWFDVQQRLGRLSST